MVPYLRIIYNERRSGFASPIGASLSKYLGVRGGLRPSPDIMRSKEYRFTVIIESCEEGGYYAECPSLSGCHVQGETYEETLAEMKSAISSFLADYHKEGDPIPEDSVTVTSLKVAV